jgi:hypothetical protein
MGMFGSLSRMITSASSALPATPALQLALLKRQFRFEFSPRQIEQGLQALWFDAQLPAHLLIWHTGVGEPERERMRVGQSRKGSLVRSVVDAHTRCSSPVRLNLAKRLPRPVDSLPG